MAETINEQRASVAYVITEHLSDYQVRITEYSKQIAELEAETSMDHVQTIASIRVQREIVQNKRIALLSLRRDLYVHGLL